MLRRLLAVCLVLAAVLLVVADVVARHVAQRAVASRLELTQPGSQVSVRMSGEPFLWFLVDKGEVKNLDVASQDYGDLASLQVHVSDLIVNRQQLLHGNLEAQSLRQLTVDATVDQSVVDQQTGVGLTLGSGTVGYRGLNVPATATISAGAVHLTLGPLPALTFTVRQLTDLGCSGTATIVPGAVQLHCVTSAVPPALVKAPAA